MQAVCELTEEELDALAGALRLRVNILGKVLRGGSCQIDPEYRRAVEAQLTALNTATEKLGLR